MAAATAAAAVKFDVTSNFKSSRKDMEREAVESFRALERAEKSAGIPELGKRFGKAMADLHENLDQIRRSFSTSDLASVYAGRRTAV